MFHFIEFNSLNDELFYLARMAELGVWPRPVSTNEVAAEITLKPFWQRTGKKLGRFPHVQLRVPSAAQVSLLR
jgi:hypothetical protein